MYLYRSDRNVRGLNLLLGNKHQPHVNEIMKVGTLASSFAVFATLKLGVLLSWDMMLHQLAIRSPHFKETQCPHLQGLICLKM
jgi:hypothetical protein